MKPTVAQLTLVIIAVASAASESRAQIGYTPRSIEWLTASSDVVVVASVAELAYEDREPLTAETQSQWVTVTLRVRRILKGEAPETIVFVIDQPRGMDLLPKWKDSGQPVLWFLVNTGDRKENWPEDFPVQAQGTLHLREHWGKFVGTSAIELARRGRTRVPRPVFSMDFCVLEEDQEIIEAVEGEVARGGMEKPRSISIRMPRHVAARSGLSGDVNQLTVPVNARLEELGRLWARSNEDWIRRAGVHALAEFRSEPKATIPKDMLNDRAWRLETKTKPASGPTAPRSGPVDECQ